MNPTKFIDRYPTYTRYNPATGAVLKTIEDVNTALTRDFSDLPTGWSTPTGGGLHQVTTYQIDALGRTTTETDPDGNVTYTVYNDTNHEIRTYRPTGPTEVTRDDLSGGYSETLTMSATPHLTGGVPDGTEAISGLQSLQRDYVNSGGQVVRSDVYFNLSSVSYSTANYIGTQNTNYYTTTDGYDTGGVVSRVQRPTGTIDVTAHDGLERVTSTSVGTSDLNQTTVSSTVYDGGSVGDGNVTQETVIPGGSQPGRVTTSYFDWRDRLVVRVQGGSSAPTPLTYYELDNEGRTTAIDLYDGSSVSVTSTNGVPDKPSAALLRARTVDNLDTQGRVYLEQVYSVNPTTGTVSTYSLNTNTYFDHRGNVIETATPGGLVTKTAFDGEDRPTVVYTTDGAGGTSWTAAGSVSSDNVLQQVETTYDAAGNDIMKTLRQRNHDETSTGALGNATTGPKARVSYEAYYYDTDNRLTATVDVGTNGGSAYTRPSSVPTRSDTVLVTSQTYDTAGYVQTETDPAGLITQTTHDALGQVSKTIESYTGSAPSTTADKTTEYTRDGDGNLLTVKVDLPGGGSETTQYIYGASTGSGQPVNSNDLLVATEYPDPSTGSPSTSQKESYTVDALGEKLSVTDRNGTVHSYSYDSLGEVTTDAVTTLGSGVDGTVMRRDTGYNVEGQAYLFTASSNTGGGSVVNQVQDVFNGLGQLTTEYQSHSGTVNTSTTPNVQYAYAEMAGGANNSRLTGITYPNGRVLTYNYNTGVDSSISRLSSISDTSATLESYAYLGLSTVVKRAHPQSGVDLTYIGTGTGDGGDQYVGLDRFDRVVDQKWVNSSTSTTTDEFRYGYDRNSNVLYRDNTVNSAFGELYSYDTENQLATFQRGTLNSTKTGLTGSASHSQSFTPDALGNFSSVTTDGTAVTRTNNLQNEVTAVGANTLAFDGNGNLTSDQNGNTLKYDAWNQLVQAKAGSTVLDTYGYDATGRRITENPGTQRDLYYSDQWQVLEERVGGSAVDQNVWSPVYVDAMIERDSGTSLALRLYTQVDANYNVTALVDTSGVVQERYDYDPFGLATVLTPSFGSRGTSSYAWVYLRQGLRLESSTGDYDNRIRWLSPTLQRFLGPDPTRFGAGDPNFYRNESNNPSTLIDPNGLQPQSERPTPANIRKTQQQRAKSNTLVLKALEDYYDAKSKALARGDELLKLIPRAKNGQDWGKVSGIARQYGTALLTARLRTNDLMQLVVERISLKMKLTDWDLDSVVPPRGAPPAWIAQALNAQEAIARTARAGLKIDATIINDAVKFYDDEYDHLTTLIARAGQQSQPQVVSQLKTIRHELAINSGPVDGAQKGIANVFGYLNDIIYASLP